MNYYYSIDGVDVLGPCSFDELKSSYLSGALPLPTQVCAEGEAVWHSLDLLLKSESRIQQQPPQDFPSRGRVFKMEGIQDLIEVYPDKVLITPRGLLGFFNKGLKGTKTIPFTSITAIQFRKAGIYFSGFLQFTIAGGNESRGGLIAAARDENSFMFNDSNRGNQQAMEIKVYIEAEVKKLRSSGATTSSNLSDELQKLANLRSQGMLSDDEFNAAKKRILG